MKWEEGEGGQELLPKLAVKLWLLGEGYKDRVEGGKGTSVSRA